MHVILWEFLAKEGREDEFEQVYGPDGPWTALFVLGDGFLGTQLLRDPAQRGRYFTVDRWASGEDYALFRRTYAKEFAALDARCTELTRRETPLGACESVE